MIRSKRRAAMLLIIRLGAAGLAAVQFAQPASGQEPGQFRPLFNGKDLSGWVTPADKTLFTVENGEIVGRTKELLKKNEFLATDKPYGDFVLKSKVKFRNGNSGIQFRSKRTEDGVVSGPQADVADGYWGLLYEERGRGILERYPEDKANALVKKNDWNEFVITAKGQHVTIDLNGTRIIDREDPKFDKQGIIALQIHVWPEPMEVRYKDIEIKELTP
jgi:3-keto-disaccharide hydrolase